MSEWRFHLIFLFQGHGHWLCHPGSDDLVRLILFLNFLYGSCAKWQRKQEKQEADKRPTPKTVSLSALEKQEAKTSKEKQGRWWRLQRSWEIWDIETKVPTSLRICIFTITNQNNLLVVFHSKRNSRESGVSVVVGDDGFCPRRQKTLSPRKEESQVSVIYPAED